MDFGKSFVYMFQDPDWFPKLAIGTLLTLAGIVLSPVLIGLIPLIIVLGYSLDVLRNVLARREHPLPEWQDWSGFLARGFKLFAALLIWSLPAIILAIPLIVGSAMANNRNAEAAAWTLIACGSCLTLLWVIVYYLVSPAIYVRVAAQDRFGAAFDFAEIWAFTRDNIGNIILATLLILLASVIIVPIVGLIGLVVCLVGVLVSLPFSYLWQMLFMAHLYGQIGAYGSGPFGRAVPEPAAPPPPEDLWEAPELEAPEIPAAPEEGGPSEGLTLPEEAEVQPEEALPDVALEVPGEAVAPAEAPAEPGEPPAPEAPILPERSPEEM